MRLFPSLVMVFILFFGGQSYGQSGQKKKIKKETPETDTQSTLPKLPDSVVVQASSKYESKSILNTIFLGKNYRAEWSTPVKLPVFNINKQNGGFRITELGGGMQTKSLRLRDKNDREWVLRSADKDVEKAINKKLRNTLAEKIVQEMISASHPYACLAVPDLANAAGVVVAKPKVFYVPDDKAFGEYRKLFANTVCFLEEREPTPDRSKTEDTEEVMEKIQEENDHLILQQTVLRARLLDMLIADWDRHPDQWRWGKRERGNRSFYYAVPKDRDFAFFNSKGLILKFGSITAVPHMKGFSSKPTGLKKLSTKMWSLDAQWLNTLSADDWRNAIISFQKGITDSVIHVAVSKIPAEVYAISGKKIENKLKQRRDGLLNPAMHYYNFLANHVYVTGTDEQELFKLKNDGSNLSVIVYSGPSENRSRILYRRILREHETKFLSLAGRGANDIFDIDSSVHSKIKLLIKGGKGKDEYRFNGKIKTRINEDKEEKAKKSSTANLRNLCPLKMI